MENAATENKQSQEIKVQNSPNSEVTKLLAEASKHVDLAAGMVSNAAKIAAAEHYKDIEDQAERYRLIVKIYNSYLGNKHVKDMFSACLAILLDNNSVRIEASAVIQQGATKGYPNGRLSFKNYHVLDIDESAIESEGKTLTSISPQDAISKLAADVLKKAARVARHGLGLARPSESKGGRPAKKNDRAPFLEEFVAAWQDDAMRAEMILKIRAFGWEVVKAKPKS